jgi:hypothetical protein
MMGLKEDIDRQMTQCEVEERFGISKRFLEFAVVRGNGPKIVRIGSLAHSGIALLVM